MLVELRLKNMAVVADAQLSLGPGLQLLTGSTGAGKSIVVEALRWLRGQRIDRSLLRSGAASASAEALFDLQESPAARDRLAELGIDLPDDGFLRVRRELRANGRSYAYLGAQQSSAGVLAAVVGELVVLQSQHQQLSLLDPSRHVELLDAAGVEPALLDAYAGAREDYFDCQRRVEEFRRERARVESERELLEYQLRELQGAGLRDGESQELLELVQRLSGGAKLLSAVASSLDALSEEESGAVARLGKASGELGDGGGLVELEEAAEQLVTAHELALEASRLLERFLQGDELDPAALDRAQERLHLLEGLQRKYGRNEAALITLFEELRAKLEVDALGEGGLPQPLAADLEESSARLLAAAEELDLRRRRVAKRLERGASALLEELAMADASLRFEFQPRVDPHSELRSKGRPLHAAADGISEIRLHARTNSGSAEGAVDRIASGGELARIGLVLRSLASARAKPAVLILDEVDAGLGADLGEAIAGRLRALAKDSQLLVISHLPAVAAAADRHFAVTKEGGEEGTVAAVRRLDDAGRERELTRMFGGHEEALQQVRRLLREARA